MTEILYSGTQELKPVYFNGNLIGFIACGESKISEFIVLECG
jgi:hypothetical protein